jgi:glutamine synthetase
MRSPDGSANVYLLLAGIAVAARYGFECANALEVAAKTYVNVNIHKDENRSILETLSVLPDSCAASADCLAEQRAVYEAEGVFAPAMIDGLIAELKAFDDRTLRADINNDQKKILALVEEYFHCG